MSDTRAVAYIAFYENAEKVELAARARGFTGNDGESWHDFVEAELDKFRTSRLYGDLNQAIEWLKSEINAHKSVYGIGHVRLQERVTTKCQHCICEGTQFTHEWTVCHEGIDDDCELSSPCYEDEP